MSATPSAHARSQYESTTGKLTARMAPAAHRANDQGWSDRLADWLSLAEEGPGDGGRHR